MNASLEPIVQWFEDHTNQSLEIHKEEDGDMDHVTLSLNRTEIAEGRTVDDYISEKRLLLYGEGTIMANQTTETIPGDVYEIPLSEIRSSNSAGSELKLSTDRGTYTIRAQ